MNPIRIPVQCSICGASPALAIEVVGAVEAPAGEMMCPACRDSVWVDAATMRELLESLDEPAVVQFRR